MPDSQDGVPPARMTSRQNVRSRSHSLMRLFWKEAFADHIFALTVIMLWEGLDMLST